MDKKFEELDISDDFMFGVVMRNPKYCKPFLETVLGDDTVKIILNTKGTMDDVSPEIKSLLDFIDGKEPGNDYTRGLAEAVKAVRNNEKWRAQNVQWTFA